MGMFSSLTDLKNNARLFPPPFPPFRRLDIFVCLFAGSYENSFFQFGSFKNCGWQLFVFRDDEHSVRYMSIL